ncbi:filamentous hemagglutinin [Saccharopolyspora erythraea NRRL 2338]|nr:filamentous hemagglutinin [Saccharopolyspora erythraea NRRL 2338]
MITELNGIRIFDTPAGRGALRRHLEDVVRSDANIIRTYTDEFGTYQIRDSLLAGPGGFLQLETAWQVTPQGLRLTTIIPRRGRK